MARRERDSEAGDQAADQAIQQVLEAEHRAREAVKGCREQAEAIREQARDRARRIAERADQRIDRIHRDCQQALESELAAIESRESADTQAAAAPYDAETVATAVRRLAAELTDGSTAGSWDEDTEGAGQ